MSDFNVPGSRPQKTRWHFGNRPYLMMRGTNKYPKYDNEQEENKPGQENEAQKPTNQRASTDNQTETKTREDKREKVPTRKEQQRQKGKPKGEETKHKKTRSLTKIVSPRLKLKCSPLSNKNIPVATKMTCSMGAMQNPPPRSHPGPVTTSSKTIVSSQKVSTTHLRGHKNQVRKPCRRGWLHGPTRGEENINTKHQKRKTKTSLGRPQSQSEWPIRALLARGTLASTVLYRENKQPTPLPEAEELLAELTAWKIMSAQREEVTIASKLTGCSKRWWPNDLFLNHRHAPIPLHSQWTPPPQSKKGSVWGRPPPQQSTQACNAKHYYGHTS